MVLIKLAAEFSMRIFKCRSNGKMQVASVMSADLKHANLSTIVIFIVQMALVTAFNITIDPTTLFARQMNEIQFDRRWRQSIYIFQRFAIAFHL